MTKVMQSVRGVVQGTLHRRKPHLMISARVKDGDGSLNDAIHELEKILIDRIGGLKAAVSDDQAVVAREAQHAEQVTEGLKANITMLETKLRETEDTLRRKEAASQKMEENLSGEIRDLQSAVKKKEEALEARESEMNVLKSKIDVKTVQVSHLELAIEHARGEAASKNQQAEQVIEGLKANIDVLENRLRETEDTVHKKEAAAKKMEASLSSKIRDLQSVMEKKEEVLEIRESEVNDLNSKMAVMAEQASQLELAIEQAKEDAASGARDAEQAIEGLKANIDVLENRLRETEDTVHRKEAASQKMEASLSSEIRDLQSVVEKKEEALEIRESEVNDLNSKMAVMAEQASQLELAIEQAKEDAASEAQHAGQVVEGLKIKISTLQAQLTQTEQIVAGLIGNLRADATIKGVERNQNRQAVDPKTNLEPQRNGTNSRAEASVDIQLQATGTVVEGEQLKTREEKATALHSQAARPTPILTDNARETVSRDAFDRMTAEFSELTNVMGSMATLILRDHVKALGESMEEFPQARLTKLVESLSKTIPDDKLRAQFCERFGKEAR